ncbi:MAG: hypothetical protein ACK5NK_16185 [Niabella sp.]
MRYLYLVLAGFTVFSCKINPTSEKTADTKDSLKTQTTITKDLEVKTDSISGDFNGDGKQEKAWLVPPVFSTEDMSCADDSCVCVINFTDKSIEPIKKSQCIGGIPYNLGDLDGDGGDEIGLYPSWFTSCWGGYRVYTIKNNKSRFLVDPITVYCDQMDQGLKPIQKDLKKKGNVIIQSSVMTDSGDIVIDQKSIRLK